MTYDMLYMLEMDINVGEKIDNNSYCSPHTGYLVEMRESSRRTWQRASHVDAIDACAYKAPGLRQGEKYLFRVAAENNVGVGEFAEMSQPVTAKSQFGGLIYGFFLFKFKKKGFIIIFLLHWFLLM